MSLAVRVIPTLLCRGRQLVKGSQFNSWRSVGLAAQAVLIHQARGVDELCLLDISATQEERGPDLYLVRELAEVLFCPLTVGGGIKTVEQIRDLLRAGADKVAIGSAVFNTHILKEASHRFGRQAIVVAVDVSHGHVWSRCGQQEWPFTPGTFAKYLEVEGAGEILLTSIDREGTLEGYDLDLIQEVSAAVPIPVIAHGGAGSYDHMLEAVRAGASAVAAGAMFQFTDQTPKGAAMYLKEHGIEART